MLKVSLNFSSANELQRQHRRTFFMLCLLTSAIFYITAANTASATTYYLDAVDGNDSNPGTSPLPWKTLAKAQSVAADGDTINLRNGNYGAFVDMNSTPVRTNWITYQAEAGQTDVNIAYIDIRNRNLYLRFKDIKVYPGNTSAQYRTAVIYFGNYVDFNNVTMTGPGLDVYKIISGYCYGIDIEASTNVTVENCIISGYKYGVRASYISSSLSSDCSITDCNIYNNRYGISVDGHRINIRRNNIHSNLSDGINFAADYSDLSNNLIHDMERPVTYSATGTFTYTDSTHTITTTGKEFASMEAASNDYLNYVVITVDGTRHSSVDWAIINSIPDANTIVLYKAIPSGEWSGYTGGNLTITKVETTPGWHMDGLQLQFTSTAVPRSTVPKYDTITNNKIYNLGYYTWSAAQGIYLGSTDTDDMTHITIENNLVYNICGGAFKTLGLVTELTMRNNTFPQISYLGNAGVSVITPKATVTTFSGNVIHEFGPSITNTYLDCTLVTNPVTFDSIENNFVSDWGVKWCQANLNTISSTNTITGMTHNQFKALFKDYDNFDFSPAAGSSLIDKIPLSSAPATDLAGHARVDIPGVGNDGTNYADVGYCEYTTSDSNTASYTLSITAAHGSVAKSPDKTSYTSGETVTLQATPGTGYHFVSWSGDASGTSDSTTITMNSNKSVTANFAMNTYTLSITATSGSVAKSPNKSSYDYGETVTLTATANYGYSFASWSGDASGTSSTTTVTMNGNKSVTANFSTLTYSLTINSSNGSVTKTPDKTVYNYGEQVTLQAVANTGYHFTGWSGSASGALNPVTITMTANKTVTASFAINTYTLATSAVFGSVTKSPSKTLYNYGETVALQAVPNTNYAFTGWSGDASGSSNPVSLTMNANKSVSANFVYTLVDNNAPTIDKSRCYPLPDAIQVPHRNLIILYLTDVGTGIDGNTVSIEVNGKNVYTGNVNSFSSSQGRCHRIGNISHFLFIYQPYLDFDYDQTVTIAVAAKDLAGNQMNDSYSFTTEMLSFGKNQKVDSGSSSLADGHTATAADSSGNIWVVWQKGATGSRDIYIGKLTADAAAFGTSAQLTNDSYDQCNPAIAVDSSEMYVVWQDNRRGHWDVFFSTSTDGATWSSAARITDFNSNHINPAIAIDRSSPNKVYVAWQDDQNVNQDIFVASSTNSFSTKTITQVTSNTSDQTKPAIVVDAVNTAYIFWTDLRNGNKDIYGAASNSGPWTNVAVVTGAGDQSEPAVAAESTGAALHLLWVDNSAGNEDIYYSACSGGLHALSSIDITDIIDDTMGADQNQPAITVSGSTGSNLKVFACWRDKRSTDTDLYLVQIGQGSGTNVFVGDDGSTSAQSGPAIGVGADGYPYIVWVDGRDTAASIYYAGATHVKADPLLEQDVSIASNTTVGTDPSAISGINDISVFFPADSYLCDVNLTCSKVENPPGFSMSILSSPYEFGPSGIDFEQPVTIVIPYIAGSGSASVYWYNTLTAQASQTGITDIQDTTIFGSLHAISFKTTHFTWYFVGSSVSTASSGGGGGGGCSLAPPGKGDGIIEFFLPFLALGLVMVIIKWQDRRNLKRSDSKTGRV